MKFLPWRWLPLSLMPFGAGLGGVLLLWPGHETPPPLPGTGLISEAAPVSSPPEPGKAGSSAAETLRAMEPGEIPDGALRLAGLDAAPTLKAVLSSAGLERAIRMNLFLRGLTKPAELAAALDEFPREEKPDRDLMSQLWLRWVEIDPATALERTGADGGGWWAWGKKDAAAALAAARTSGPNALAAVIRAIAESDHAEGARLAALYPESGTEAVWSGIMDDLSRTDPAGAAAMALRKNLPLDKIAAGWMDRSPAAALAWAKGQAEGFDRRRATAEVIRQLSLKDPAAALREASRLPPGARGTGGFQ